MGIEARKLLGDDWLAWGRDKFGNDGQCKIHSPAWTALTKYHEAVAEHEAEQAVAEEKLAPFFEAVTAIQQLRSENEKFDWGTVVIEEAVAEEPGQVFTLDEGGILLRQITTSDQSNLVWVTPTELAAFDE